MKRTSSADGAYRKWPVAERRKESQHEYILELRTETRVGYAGVASVIHARGIAFCRTERGESCEWLSNKGGNTFLHVL